MIYEIDMPSGLRGSFRDMTVADEDALAEAQESGKQHRQEKAINGLMRNCWQGTEDPGPYRQPDDEEERKFDLSDLLMGDKLYYALQLRIESSGDTIKLDLQCPSGHNFTEEEFNLRSLKVKNLSEAMRDRMRRGEPTEFTLPRSGRTVKYVPVTARMQESFAKTVRSFKGQMSTELLAMRVVGISGFADTGLDEETGYDLRGFLRSLSSFDARALRLDMLENDCGVDTEIPLTCSECGREFKHDLLEGGDGFFGL
jgi:hypothetical protein